MSEKCANDLRSEALVSKLLFFHLIIFWIVGCSTAYEATAVRSWDWMAAGDVDTALAEYEENVTAPRDRLLRLMDEGILLRTAGDYEESNQRLLAAAEIIEQNGYLSLGEEAASLLTNEKLKTYQGEDFERVLVHVFLALNFIQLEAWESALVEARRVNEILYQMISEGNRPYELNAFSRYLTANLFEKGEELNSAYVDYKKFRKRLPRVFQADAFFKLDLMRVASKMGFREDLQSYREDFGEALWKLFQKQKENNYGSLLFLFENGKSPIKFSSKERHVKTGRGGTSVEILIPVAYYKRRDFQVTSAQLRVADKKEETVVLNDIESVAVKHLQDRMGRAIAKALATAAVKAGIGVAVGKATDSAELGILAALGLMLASDADTRSWLLLPAKLQAAKIYLPPGTYQVQVDYQDQRGQVVSQEVIDDLEILPNEITFLQRRVFR